MACSQSLTLRPAAGAWVLMKTFFYLLPHDW